MGNKSSFIVRNLSALVFLLVYLVMVVIHLISDSFILEDQLYLIIYLFPFVFIGLALDYLLRQNSTMKTAYQIFIKLLPLGVFLMIILSSLEIFDSSDTPAAFDNFFWIFISLPFFLTSYQKDKARPRLLHSLIGTGAVTAIYIYLTTQTEALDRKYGAILIIISYFLLLYTASGIERLPYVGLILGCLNAVILLLLRYYPITQDAISGGWDIDIANKIDMLLVFTSVFSILVRVYEEYITRKNEVQSSEQ